MTQRKWLAYGSEKGHILLPDGVEPQKSNGKESTKRFSECQDWGVSCPKMYLSDGNKLGAASRTLFIQQGTEHSQCFPGPGRNERIMGGVVL